MGAACRSGNVFLYHAGPPVWQLVMRLTKLKLAGFKSFVDPTTVSLPGQLVGVVGPNGCGKSNIMDAVRWVLGESKASELRGESMQDVIFNGSNQRQPVSRASVELVFDNSLGRALGQWSQYAELSVKRVLTRSGQSDYFINQLKVRRKDITDLFLGTGLGPRAYAIIGQGMISRIIEARPDDLRVFLEEAAGVSRYKERRKETQGRLEDTRDNLLRVDDIRQELGQQLVRLEEQAAIARKYHELHGQQTHKQHLLWWLKEQEAAAERDRLRLEIAHADTELERRNAALIQIETESVRLREAHFVAGDAVHQAQSALYAANAEVARLEAELRHHESTRRELAERLETLSLSQAEWQETAAQLTEERGRWETLQEVNALRAAEAEERLAAQMDLAPQVEEDHAQAQEELQRLRTRIATAEHKLEVERTHQAHAQRALQSLLGRQAKVLDEGGRDDALLEGQHQEKEEELTLLREELAGDQDHLQQLQSEWPQRQAQRQAAQDSLNQLERRLAALVARQTALEQVQARQAPQGALSDWLVAHGLEQTIPLWKVLAVSEPWLRVVTYLLAERLNALTLPSEEILACLAGGRPPAQLHLVSAITGPVPQDSFLPELALSRQITVRQGEWSAVLQDWLMPYRTISSLEEAWARRADLPPGMMWVTPSGELVSRHAVFLSALAGGAAEGQGLLERQREIEGLAAQRCELEEACAAQQGILALLDEQLEDQREEIAEVRQYVQDRQQRVHALQIEVVRLAQTLVQMQEARARQSEQLASLAEEIGIERERELAADERIAEITDSLSRVRMLIGAAQGRLETCERAVRTARAQHADLDRMVREAQFSLRECDGKLQDIFARQALAQRELSRLETEYVSHQARLAALPESVMDDALQDALLQQQTQTEALMAAREALESATQALRQQEEERLRLEQGLEPLRQSISALMLKEQAAALGAAQFAGLLEESGADVVALAPFAANARPAAVQGEITRLANAIQALGAVNLAALAELETATERKNYLDAQAADLTEAMEMLERAIRRIDRETRELLQSTFDTVNGHFGTLFPELFGGGRAALVMTGEEILDAGVQVIAQPPGKKNATIHLLSGGEKALTAIALVFAMFQLNPAPFCLLDEVDAPLDDSNTERFCGMVKKMSGKTQFLFISHNKIAMEMAEQLVGVTMQESGVSRVVEVDIEAALKMRDAA